MKKTILLSILLLAFTTGKISAQLSATTSFINPNCTNTNGSATVTPTGGNNYTYKWSNGATTATANNLVAGTYTVTVYSTGGTIWDTLYLETFEGAQTWTLNIATGTNGADPNFWEISGTENGTAPGSCGSKNGSNSSLYITSVAQFTTGAAYDAGGFCGTLFCPETNTAAQSANINTTGAHHLVLQYDFMARGQALVDNASSFYSINGGTGFTSLDASLKSAQNCGGSESKWNQRSYNLPVACNNINNFVVRFNWTNDDDGVGSDPSVAINNVLLRDSLPGAADSIVKTVTLTQPTAPHFVTAALSVVNPGCGQQNGSINNMGVAGGTPSYTLAWKLGGATIGSTNSLTNLGPGTYTFEATDANGCVIDTAFTLVTTGSGGSATISSSKQIFCASDSTQICVTGTFTTYLWSNGATAQCITVHQAGNYYVTVTDNTGCTAVSNHLAITVYPLPPVSISVNGDTLTAHNANTYQWYVGGNSITGATDSVFIATQGGVYTVTVADSNGCHAISNGITISGVDELQTSDFGFRIFPNPSTGEVNIFVDENLIGQEFFISDVVGRIVWKEKISVSKIQLSTSNFANGIYFVRIKNAVMKLAKQ